VIQEAVKRILKQKSHLYEVCSKSYKVIFSTLFKQTQNIMLNCYIARSKLQPEPIWAPCECWQRRRVGEPSYLNEMSCTA